LIFALLALVFSWLAWLIDWSAIHPGTNEEISPVNLLSSEGLHRILLEMVDNYTGFAPLGIVMVALLGIGIAEKSGLISALIRLLILSAPQRLLTFVIVFSGILSNIASDVGYVLLIPLAGIIFQSIDLPVYRVVLQPTLCLALPTRCLPVCQRKLQILWTPPIA